MPSLHDWRCALDTTEFCILTEETLAALLSSRAAASSDRAGDERRSAPRWPFPGTVELWLTDDSGVEELRLATCVDLSCHGVGIKAEFELEAGLELALAIHQPEVSLQGRAVVRHCTEIETGYYMGLQFLFEG